MHVHFLSPVVNYYFNRNTSCHFFTWASNCKHTSVLIVGHHPTDGVEGSRWVCWTPWRHGLWLGWLGEVSQTSPVINQLGRTFFIQRYGYTSNSPVITTTWGCLLFGLPGLPYQDTNVVGSRNLLNAECILRSQWSGWRSRIGVSHRGCSSKHRGPWGPWPGGIKRVFVMVEIETGGNLSWWPCQNDETKWNYDNPRWHNLIVILIETIHILPKFQNGWCEPRTLRNNCENHAVTPLMCSHFCSWPP